jgi:hypothetical protein
MPGGFHPFHAGHMALYNSARKAFPDADLYVAATNSQEERPFPFAVKEKLAKVAGVEPGHFVQVKSPFQAKEITQNYNPEQDVLIFVRSEKDRNESPKPGGTKKDGSPAYFQPWTGKDVQPFGKHGYFAYLPTVKFGPGITSATEIRKAWPTLDDRRKTAMVMSLYPAAQKNQKLAANIVAMLDQVMGGQLNEFAPSDDGDNGQEDMFFKYAKLWYNGNLQIQQRIEEVLAQAGWEIGELESEEGGAFIVKTGDENGDTYMGWPAEDLGDNLNEFAPGNGDDGLPQAEYVVYQCDPSDQFEFIGGPLYQTDSLGMAHKYAYEKYVKHRPLAFMIYQPHIESSRGNYGVKGISDGTEEVDEGKSNVIARTASDLSNPPKVMQHRAKRDMERDEQLKGRDIAKRDDDEMFVPGDSETERLMRYVQQHYPNATTKQQAFIKFAQRALQHSKDEDEMQDKEITDLKQEVNKIKQVVDKFKVTESSDYLEEK